MEQKTAYNTLVGQIKKKKKNTYKIKCFRILYLKASRSRSRRRKAWESRVKYRSAQRTSSGCSANATTGSLRTVRPLRPQQRAASSEQSLPDSEFNSKMRALSSSTKQERRMSATSLGPGSPTYWIMSARSVNAESMASVRLDVANTKTFGMNLKEIELK